jgi:hypothetical protein
MSRIRRLSQVISEEGRRALASQQASRIRDTAFGIVDQANLNASTSRKITKKAAFTVVLRSLQSTRNLPFSLREHMAIRELSQYITLAQSDKSTSLTLSNTDLLPVSHPRSTRNHSMTASALTEARARWVADDPRIVDGYAKTIIASALTSKYASVEHVYYNSILSSLPQGVVPAEVIVAASNPFSGGNSSAERSLRARLQRRDREGKFAFMGGGLSALVRKSNGRVYNLVGRPIIDGPNGDDIQMELPDGKIVNIPASKGMFIKAVINPTSDGYSKNTAKTATTKNIINEEDLVYVDAPQGWSKTGTNTWNSEDGWGIEKGRDKNGYYQYEIKDPAGKTVGTSSGDWEDALDNIAEKKEGKKAVLPSDDKFVEEIIMDPPKDGKGGGGRGGDGGGPKTPKPFEFKYPQGAVKIKIDESYDPEGRVDEESPDFTDDPVELGQKFDPRDLIQALEQGVLPENKGDNAVGYGVLRFNGGDEYVPVQALYNALDEAGEDAALELARIYDKGLGSNNNENALKDNRKGIARLDQSKPDVAESFERTVAMNPDEVPATEVPKFSEAEMDLPPVLEGLSDAEMRQFIETGDHTPYLPENESIDMPEGYSTLDPSPFSSWREVTADTPDAVLPEGFSDNPVFLAQSIDKQSLEAELRRSIEPDSATPGYANISLQDEDGEEFVANIPGEAVRDALQLQGVDTNEFIKKISDEGFAGQNNEMIMDPPMNFGPDKDKKSVDEIIMDPPKDPRGERFEPAKFLPEGQFVKPGDQDAKDVNKALDFLDKHMDEEGTTEDRAMGISEAQRHLKEAKEYLEAGDTKSALSSLGTAYEIMDGLESPGEGIFPNGKNSAEAADVVDKLMTRLEENDSGMIMDPPMNFGPDKDDKSLGKEIYERRIATGDSLDKVAEDLGLTRLEVRRLEADYARSLEGKDDPGMIMDPPMKFGKEADPQAELPLDTPAEPKPMNAYERLMAEKKAERDAVDERVAKLKKDAEDGVDDLGRTIPEGWGAEYRRRGLDADPDNFYNVYGNNTFEATVDKDGKITVRDRNELTPDKSYDNWDDLKADLENQRAEYSSAARARVAEIAKQYGYSDEQIASFDSMSQQELADFFANPDNHTPAYADALVDWVNSFAVDLPSPQQKARWSEFGKNEKILAQAGDAPSGDSTEQTIVDPPKDATPENPLIEKPVLDNLVAEINKNERDGYKANGLNFVINRGAFGAKAENIEVIPDNWEPGDPVVARIDMDGGIDWESDAQFDKYAKDMDEALNGLDSGTLPSDPKEIGKNAFAKGKERNAAADPDLVNLMEGKSSAERNQLMKDWFEGWDRANVSMDIDAPTPKGLDTTDNKELIAKFKREYVKEFLDQEEALADKYQAEEDMDRGDAQAVAEADMKRMYGKTAMEALNELPREEGLKVLEEREQKPFNFVDQEEKDISAPSSQAESVVAVDVNSPNLQEEIQSAIDKGQKIAFSYNGKNRVVTPQSIWTNPKNGNVNLRAIEDGPDGVFKVFTLDKMEMAKSTTPPPAPETKPKDLSEADIAVIKNNEYVIANAGVLLPTEAKDLQVGDFLYNAFYDRYEQILEMKPADLGRIEFRVFNVYNNQEEDRFFVMDSPLRNVRRLGIEDQAETIPPVKAAPRGGKRGLIERAPLSEQVRAKTGRPVARQKEEEGLFKDKNGVPIKPGDVVIHPKHPEWGRGVVKNRIGAQVREGKKAGGQVRAGKVQANKLLVQFEGGNLDWVLGNAGRDVKAGYLELYEGNYDDLVLDPRFRGGAMIPNAPANPAPASPPQSGDRDANLFPEDVRGERPVPPAPEQGRLLDTPEGKPAAPVAPGMPKPIYKAEVEDQKGNKFKISVVKIDDMYEAAVFNENGDLNAVIAKNISLGEVQGVIGQFIGEVADSNDGEKVLRAYGGFPDPVEQPVLTVDTPDVPPLPAVKAIQLKEAKARAMDLAVALRDKELPGDARKDLTPDQQQRLRRSIELRLAVGNGADALGGVDRRQNARFNSDLGVAYRYAVVLGWFEEAQKIAALQKRVDKLPIRDGGEDFNNKIADLREMHPEFFGNNMELELAKRLDYNGRRRVDSLMNAYNDLLVNPDVYNPNFRAAIVRGRGDIDAILASIDRPNPVPADAVVIDRLKDLKKRFDAVGDLPKVPSREVPNDDMANHLADIAREFEGLGYKDLLNGYGNWKFEKKLSAANNLNTVFLLRNALTGERIVIKYDNDGNRGDFKGNGIKAEEMVAELYRDLGFAQPAVAVINPDNLTPDIGGVGVMQYADAGFFGLVNIEVHNKSAVYSLDQVSAAHREELLHFLVANAIIGNTDRHGGNFMWGNDPATGKARLVPIDNGLAMFNGAFGEPEKNINNPLHLDPNKVVLGNYGNFNQVGRLAKQFINQGYTPDQIANGEQKPAAVAKVVEFATRMRERAEAMKFRDARANEYLIARADYILKNPEKFVDTLLTFR